MSRVRTVEVLDKEEENSKADRNRNILKEKDKKLVNPTSIVYQFIKFITLIINWNRLEKRSKTRESHEYYINQPYYFFPLLTLCTPSLYSDARGFNNP